MIYRYLSTSSDPIPKLVRRIRRGWHNFTLPAPKIIVLPMLWLFLALRHVYFTLFRLFVCEPLFKAYCKSYGKNVRTNVHIHWIQGKGDIIVGDNVEIRGKCSFTFAARFSDRPQLVIGNNTNIGHSSSITVGKSVEIGDHCLIASDVSIFDSSGHPSDPTARMANMPLSPDEVKPIKIGNNVWIGQRSIITPGVTIGDNSIVSAASVVIGDVPPNTIVAGYPARKIGALQPPGSAATHAGVAGQVNANASKIA